MSHLHSQHPEKSIKDRTLMSQKVFPHSFFSEADIYLFKEGKHYGLHHKFGAHPTEVDGIKGTYFAVFAPAARAIEIIGDFNHWNGGGYNLNVRWDSSGIWEGFLPNVQVGNLYKYKIFSNHQEEPIEKADPYARRAEHPPRTASVVHLHDYGWKDKKWMKIRKAKNALNAPMSVYEMHMASWRKKDNGSVLGYKELAAQLVPYLVEAGFTHVEFMPVMEYPYEPSWGYQITGYFAPSSRFGPPEDFAFLVDALHQASIGVLLDWVPSHFPEDKHGLGKFDGSAVYEHPDWKRGYHPDWKSLIFNYGRAEIKSFLISNAIYWLEEFHIDGLRVDAVASMLYLDYSREEGQWEANQFGGNENLEAIAFIKDFNEAVYGQFPDVQTIAEESTNFTGVSRPTFAGGLGFGLKWMMGWMNDTLTYFAKDPIYRQHHHSDITFSLVYAFTENFMLPLSHDEVVYGKKSLLEKMPGDNWQQFANLRLLYSLMYLHPGAKLIFMGGEFGQRAEWDFEHSLSWGESGYEAHRGIFETIKSLNALYKNEGALYELNYEQKSFQWIEHNDHGNSIISFIRKGTNEKEQLICVLNFTPMTHDAYEIGVPLAGKYEEVFNSDKSNFWGSGFLNSTPKATSKTGKHGFENSLTIKTPPLGASAWKLMS